MRFLITSIFFFIVTSLIAQTTNDHKHCDLHPDHFHDKELGLSIAPVWLSEEEGVMLGLHAHFIKRIGDTQFGLGGGVEYILDEHRHQTYSLAAQFTPLPALHFIVAPGIALEIEDDEIERGWAVHFELCKEFSIWKLDVGPAIEFALDSHGQHIACGIHVGIPFE